MSNTDSNTVEKTVEKIHKAADAVTKLRDGVDPGHVPFIKYLTAVIRNLRATANDVEQSCREESGERLR
jgi:hypothetical protein